MKTAFKEYTNSKRLTQKEIATESGMSASGVSTFLRRDGMNDTAILYLIAVGNLLDKTPGEVLDEIIDLKTKEELLERATLMEANEETAKTDHSNIDVLKEMKIYNAIVENSDDYRINSISDVKKTLRNKDEKLTNAEQSLLEADDHNFYLLNSKENKGKMFASMEEIAKYMIKNALLSDKATKQLQDLM